MIRELAIGASAFGTLGDLLQFNVGQDAPDAYFNLRMTGQQTALAEDVVGTTDMQRQHVTSAMESEITGAALEFVNRAVGRAGAFGEHQDAAAGTEFGERVVEGFHLRAFAIKGNQAGEVGGDEAAQGRC